MPLPGLARCRVIRGRKVRLARLFVIAVLLFAPVAGCAPSAPNLASPGVFPGGVPVTEEHVLAPSDEIEVRFPFYPDLNDRVLVGPDGRLSLQLVNTVAVGGTTVADATKLINDRYAKVIEDPLLKSYDVVYVPQTVFASLQDFLTNYIKNTPFYFQYTVQ